MMALGSEEGGLEWINAGENAQWDRGQCTEGLMVPSIIPRKVGPDLRSRGTEHTRKSFRPHENAIFDLKWSLDDNQIVRLLRHQPPD